MKKNKKTYKNNINIDKNSANKSFSSNSEDEISIKIKRINNRYKYITKFRQQNYEIEKK